MGLVTLPNPLTDGTSAKGSDVFANDTAILTQAVNGFIADANIQVGAGIQGSKLSNVVGSQIPTDRIADDAVTAAKLRDDAGTDANRAVTTDHIRDAAVTTAKIAALAVTTAKIAAAAVLSGNIAGTTLFFDWAPGGAHFPGDTGNQSTGITTSQGIPLGVEMRLAGVPSANTMPVSIGLHLNTSNSTYYITYCVIAGTPNFTGLTFRAKFISAT